MIYLIDVMITFTVGIVIGAVLKDSLLRIVKKGIKVIEDWSKEV